MDCALFLLELKNILDMLQLENNELQGLKLQHDQKVSELEKTQVEVLEVMNEAVLPLANCSLSLWACVSPLLSDLGETGVREPAADSPATERGDRVAEAAPREGQTGSRADDCRDPSVTVIY